MVKFVQEARCYYRSYGQNQVSRDISEEACKSVLLVLRLCIGYLRSLEDSERTRRASLTLLGTFVPFFYREQNDLLKEMNSIATELGGELMPAKLGWKFNLMQGLFGRKVAKKVKDMVWKLDLARAVKWDEMLYRITRSSAGKH
jgi:hypothetical protein